MSRWGEDGKMKETPKNCCECKYSYPDEDGENQYLVCGIKEQDIPTICHTCKSVPVWCPLQEVDQ